MSKWASENTNRILSLKINLDKEQIIAITNTVYFKRVIFQIPKFSFGSEINLNDTFKSMEIISAFKKDADFINIADDMAFVSSIKFIK